VTCFRLWMSVADFVFEPRALAEGFSSAISVLLLLATTSRSNTAALVLVAALRYPAH
jgi:hypothetical protein